MEGTEREAKDEALKSALAIRCAKAASLLSAIKLSPNRRFETRNDDEDGEREMMMKEIEDLKIKLARERMKSKRIKLCGLAEVILQVLVVLFISSFFLIIAFR